MNRAMNMAMKRVVLSSLVMLLAVAPVGCGAAARTIAAKSQGERTDVFTEVTGPEALPAGYAEVAITAEIKTHREGHYLLERRHSPHGKPRYRFLVNIDGQAAVWKVEGKKHEIPEYVDGKTNTDPEAGKGIKYVLNKRLRLEAGSHTVLFGLPADDYYREVVINVKEGETQILEFRPVYKYKRLPTRIPTFMKGISNYDIFFNGKLIAL